MTADISSLDAHEQPSDELRAKWKEYVRMEMDDVLACQDIDDTLAVHDSPEFVRAGEISQDQLSSAFAHLLDGGAPAVERPAPIYYHPLLPGLLIIPSVVPPEIQKILLGRLVHRDLTNPRHKTNLHLHYDVPYPKPVHNGAEEVGQEAESESFFSYPPDSPIHFQPKDASVHKPLSVRKVLERRLHWVTLGGQYDWTSRVYPPERPPEFPPDLAAFLGALFPETVAQAAIVNFYSPGDTMMMHRDVSEQTDRGLISLSIGCDSLFMIAPNDDPAHERAASEPATASTKPGDRGSDGRKKTYLLLRLRSGDAIYMTKESRFAWHGVPKVLKGTCPPYLEDWPAEDGRFEAWRGWMKNKRINLNVRQMNE
ncbi:hypothetical protein VTK73DRAFT_9024 [Phialemonium thermophilum]|uniref:Fe2OG dioxygenase domain-containing protein n=1 Tax=Phialemonium thermophilum TaxID=223376 RepID=A0ABR3W520_9PEZI